MHCLPSKNEGLPMSILEAMAIDVSTIATPAGETPQLINDGVDGFLVTGDNKKVLASD
ncbi:MAG: glycosyltransferase [Collinsella sp.]